MSSPMSRPNSRPNSRRSRQSKTGKSTDRQAGDSGPLLFFAKVKTMSKNTIEIIGKYKDTTEVLDEANNKKDADEQVDYWQELLGRDWKVTTKSKR